ncbi:hypothetical protein GCM10010247_30880 [Streptomyces calvus]|nr:hypothetical protein GCM10010247_30880 [Streptomyces calvus]
MDAHVVGGLQQRGQAADDVAGEQLAGQVRPRVGHGPETVEDLDVLVADEGLLAERAGDGLQDRTALAAGGREVVGRRCRGR